MSKAVSVPRTAKRSSDSHTGTSANGDQRGSLSAIHHQQQRTFTKVPSSASNGHPNPPTGFSFNKFSTSTDKKSEMIANRKAVVEVHTAHREALTALHNECLSNLKSVVISYLNAQPVGTFASIPDKDTLIAEQTRARDDAKARSEAILERHGQLATAYIASLPDHARESTTALFVRMNGSLGSPVAEALTAVEGLVKKRVQRLIKIRGSESEMVAKVERIYEGLGGRIDVGDRR